MKNMTLIAALLLGCAAEPPVPQPEDSVEPSSQEGGTEVAVAALCEEQIVCPEGPEGAEGPRGPAGADGLPGPAGVDGTDGEVGARGLPGATGARGPGGLQGPQGSLGPRGLQGLTGSQGPQGLKGDQGDTGSVGPLGPKGDTGDQGEQGPQGVPGADGSNGAPGLTLFEAGNFYTRSNAVPHTNLSTSYAYGIAISCFAGDILIHGGCRSKMWVNQGGIWYPTDEGVGDAPADLISSYPNMATSDPLQWVCRFWPNDPDAHLGVYVWCLDVPELWHLDGTKCDPETCDRKRERHTVRADVPRYLAFLCNQPKGPGVGETYRIEQLRLSILDWPFLEASIFWAEYFVKQKRMSMKLDNPLLQEYEKCRRVREGGYGLPSPVSAAAKYISAYSDNRKECVKRWAWAIPNDEAIHTIAKYSPIIELGAGTGYWTWMLRQAGADVVAYDKEPGNNDWCEGTYADVLPGCIRPLAKHRDRTLFLCWPPYNKPFAYRALQVYGGDTLLYVGEGDGGCTGCERFHTKLDKEWDEVEYVGIPTWWGINDYLAVYKRK